MIDHVKAVLADPKTVVPDYNAKDGYELAGIIKKIPSGRWLVHERTSRGICERIQPQTHRPEKLAIWNRGRSNAAYHYLGAAKILAPIGKAFAEAALALEKK